jgi:hypothetical protein
MWIRFCFASVLAALCALRATPAHAVSDVYAIDIFSNPNLMVRFPVNEPAHNVISHNAGFTGYAMDFNVDCTILWGITESPNRFGTISTTTGNFTPIAAPTGALPETTNFDGMSVDPLTDEIYVLGSTGMVGNCTLYTIDRNTAALTVIGPLGIPLSLFAGLAIDRNGLMYAHDIWTDSLFRVDKTTGQATLIGPTGFFANFAQGMDFDWETNRLYAALYAIQGAGMFAELDVTTGKATMILDTTPWRAEMEMAIASPIPEPACVAVLAAIVAMTLCWRRARATCRL